jgi:FHS family L-fucose permease-like MFS transporter
VGSFLGPIIASYLFFGGDKDAGNLDSVKMIYIIIGIVVLVIAGLFIRTPLPEIKEDEIVSSASLIKKPLFSHSNFTNGVIAQFFYVAAQVGVAALFINYCTESSLHLTSAKGAQLIGIGLILFTVGRFAGTALMRVIAANKLLTIYSIINIFLCAIVIANKEWLSVYALMGVFFFESIMFPTIFALGVKDLGHHTKKGASFIIMSIVGGALMPYVMGVLAEKYSTATSYSVPLVCFVVVAWYGWRGYIVKGGDNSAVKVEFKH